MSIAKKNYRLGDVAFEVKRKLPTFMESHIQWCIRGEDFDSESLRFIRKGSLMDAGPTFFRHFLPGDFLYMTRNPRLKKGAIADFEGVAANTTLILNQKISKEFYDGLLPHIMQSELFHAYAESVAVGSTNLFTKWIDLKRFEFSLPSVREQERLIKILEKVVECIHLTEDLVEHYSHLKAALINSVITEDKECFVSIRNFSNSDLKNGYSPLEDAYKSNYWSFSISAVRSGIINIKQEHKKKVFIPDDIQDNYRIKKDDVFIVRGNGNRDLVGVCGRAENDIPGYIYPDILIKLEVDTSIFIPEFFVYVWNSAVVRKQIDAIAQTTNGTYKINQKGILGIKLPKIPIAVQKKCVDKFNLIESAEETLLEKHLHLKTIYQRLINNLIC